MQSYFQEIETVYNEAVKKLKAKLVEIRDMQKLAKARMEKYTAERDVKDKTRTLQRAWRRIGDEVLGELESRRAWTPEVVTEMKIKLDDSSEALTLLNLAVERLVALDLSSVQELIEQSQDIVLTSGDKIDEVYFALEVSQQTRYPQTPDRRGRPPPTAGSPPPPSAPGLPQPLVREELLSPGLRGRESEPMGAGRDRAPRIAPGIGKRSKISKNKAVDMTVFDGKRHNWPDFKMSWQILEAQEFPKLHLSQQLRNCVCGNTFELIRTVKVRDDDSYNTMRKRLVSYYDEQGQVLGSLINELEGLKLRSHSDRDIIRFIKSLEVIYESLFSISAEHPKK